MAPLRRRRSQYCGTEWGSEAEYPGDWADPIAADAVQAEAEARTVYDAIAAEFALRGVTDA